MLAQRDLTSYTPPHRPLAILRQRILRELTRCPCSATQQRVLLAVNEIVANVLRHAHPQATDIQFEFIDHDQVVYCVVRDDGGKFEGFESLWRECTERSGRDMFRQDRLGLKMVRHLWPRAFYVPRSDAFPYNSFILPLTAAEKDCLPSYFHTKHTADWNELVAPLSQEIRV